ncbi:carboxymuconolactone decarboxylase family protein [Tropicibacter naphthalenivorans]|uniref:4-carboxymuconolactone decarboxylase n=1 Tax=Tropicibacter naphthalenivorans TaxID=441103 RepID=A0A0P1GH57_9RHOB|nr:carboxymuconolactone decarboxylase family protein [Tropicibacter naphthalenivorans]CUH81277.1 4-carboxymuconolactone decarboxylase [Tropicibacter naphthalenivorans]SMC98078.1 4-carboxymuconolactone decarboxylase [Tropicibacter naphthalenivorans]
MSLGNTRTQKDFARKTQIAASAIALMGTTTTATAQDLTQTLPQEVGTVAPALMAYITDGLFGTVWNAETLSMRDRALVTFAAMVTRGEGAQLGEFTALALDAGVTPAELSETITHLAFYTGWGNATAAAQAMAPVYAARGASADDLPGASPDLLPLNQKAEDARQNMVQNTYGDVSQGVVDYTQEMLFLDLWLRPDLAPRDRSLVTVAGLIAAGQPEQMTFHLNRAMDNGLTQTEAGGMLAHLAFYAGWPRVFSAMPVAKEVFANRAQ